MTSSPKQRSAYNRRYYEGGGKQKIMDKKKEYIKRNQEYVNSIKEMAGCTDCGVTYPHYVLQFDHVGGKEWDIGRMCCNAVSITKLQAEIDKCEVVCANCHSTRTHHRRVAQR